jgi:sugar phosphate isomerase/epimerase
MMKKLFFCLSAFLSFWLSNGFAQSGRQLFTAPIGVQMYTYRSSYTKGMTAVLDTIKSLGIKEVEGFNPKNIDPHHFKKMLDQRGISMPSIGFDYDYVIQHPDSAAAVAKIFGAKYLMIAWIPHGSAFNITDAKKAVADFNRIGRFLKSNGIIFCYHTHGYEFARYQDGTLFDYIAKHTNPKYVSFEMDMLWSFHGGADPAKLLNKYKGRWKLAHLKDLRKGIAGDHTGATNINNDVALGTGQLNIPAILKAAKSAGVQHYFIEDESPSHAAQIPVTIKYIRGLRK